MAEKATLVESIQRAASAEVLEGLLQVEIERLGRTLFLLSDAAQKFALTTGHIGSWSDEDIDFIKLRLRMFQFLRKHTWLLM